MFPARAGMNRRQGARAGLVVTYSLRSNLPRRTGYAIEPKANSAPTATPIPRPRSSRCAPQSNASGIACTSLAITNTATS